MLQAILAFILLMTGSGRIAVFSDLDWDRVYASIGGAPLCHWHILSHTDSWSVNIELGDAMLLFLHIGMYFSKIVGLHGGIESTLNIYICLGEVWCPRRLHIQIVAGQIRLVVALGQHAAVEVLSSNTRLCIVFIGPVPHLLISFKFLRVRPQSISDNLV